MSFPCSSTLPAGTQEVEDSWQGLGPAPPTRRHKWLPETPEGTRSRLRAERAAGHGAGEEAGYLTDGWGGESDGGPTTSVTFFAPRLSRPLEGGHATPRHSLNRHGPSAHLSRYSQETNSGEGAPWPLSRVQAQARGERGMAGKARGKQGGRRKRTRRCISAPNRPRAGDNAAPATRRAPAPGGTGSQPFLQASPPRRARPPPVAAAPGRARRAASPRRATAGRPRPPAPVARGTRGR